MARLPRLKPRGQDQTYHLYNRLAGEPGLYPLQHPGVREKLFELLVFYASIYFCVLAAFAVMGNHYHALARFRSFRVLTRAELRCIAERLYRDRWYKPYLFWRATEWRRFNCRLFDVSEFMRNVESDYARWHNRHFGRKGQLWADRFKSNLLTSARAAQAVALYIELNPLRARLVRRPEEYRFSSARLRLAGVKRPDWLMPLSELWGGVADNRAVQLHFGCLQHRGGVRIENEDKLLRAIIRQDEAEGYLAGAYLEHQRYMNDARAMGDEEQIRALREHLVAQKVYRKVRSPAWAPVGLLALLSGQRNHVVSTNSREAA